MGFFDAFFKEQQRTKSEEIYDRALQILSLIHISEPTRP